MSKYYRTSRSRVVGAARRSRVVAIVKMPPPTTTPTTMTTLTRWYTSFATKDDAVSVDETQPAVSLRLHRPSLARRFRLETD